MPEDGIPLLSVINLEFIPLDLISTNSVLETVLQPVFIVDYIEETSIDDEFTLEYSLSFGEDELAFNVVGIDGVELVFGGQTNELVRIGVRSESTDNLTAYILGVVHLRFTSELLKPMIDTGSEYISDPNNNSFSISLAAGIELDQDKNVSFIGNNSFVLTPVGIGNSGVIIEGEIAFDLSKNDSLAESTAMGLDPSWRGVVFRQLSIHLPSSLNIPILPSEITLVDFHIGNGGLSGDITGTWDNVFNSATGELEGNGVGELFGIEFSIKELGISFRQNTLTNGDISGCINVPFFEAPLLVNLTLTNNGDFAVAVASQDGIITLEKENVISITLDSVSFIKDGDEYAIRLSGLITPLLGEFEWPSFAVDELIIYADGRVKFAGGWIELPEQKGLNFNGFMIEISKLGIGSEDIDGDKYNWVGFSGGVQLTKGLPLKGGVEGLKLMWNTRTNEPRLQIGGVSLAFEIKKILAFDGQCFFFDEEDAGNSNNRIKGFKGSVKVTLVPLNGAGFEAQFIAGKNAEFKFFYIFIDVSLPIGVPILPPTLGLYGVSGFFAHNMTLDYPALLEYDDVAARPNMTDIGNWLPQKDALAFGAGVTVGTLADNAFTVEAKVVLAVLLPGPVILIEGHVGILSSKGEFPLRILAVLDIPSATFLTNIGISFKNPADSGDLLNVTGSMELFIPAGDMSGWYLYIGEKEPESKRIIANVLGFFTAQSYFMVDNNGLLFGVHIGYALDKKFGPLRVLLEAWFRGELAVSWTPLQAQGSIMIIGRAELSVAGIGLSLSIEALAAVEVPKPLRIFGEVRVELNTPVGNPKANLEFKWEKEATPAFPLPLSGKLGIEHRKVSDSWNIPKASVYEIDEDGLYSGSQMQLLIAESQLSVVPVDVNLVLNFDKSVSDTNAIGGNLSQSSNIERAGAFEFKYELLDVRLECSDTWNSSPQNNTWESFEQISPEYSMVAAWQAIPDSNGLTNTKLLVNALSSLQISRLLQDNTDWINQLSLHHPNYPCIETEEPVWQSIEFPLDLGGTELFPLFGQDGWRFESTFPLIFGKEKNPSGTASSTLTTDVYLQEVHCLHLPFQKKDNAQQQLTIDDVEVHASTRGGEFVRLRRESKPLLNKKARTELFINKSLHQAGHTLAYMEFPVSSAWGPWSGTVMITLMVQIQNNTRIEAQDINGNVVASITDFSPCENHPYTFILNSSSNNPIHRIEFRGRRFRIREVCWNRCKFLNDRRLSELYITPSAAQAVTRFHFLPDSNGSIITLDAQGKRLSSQDFKATDPDQIISLEAGEAVSSFMVVGDMKLWGITSLSLAEFNRVNEHNSSRTQFRDQLQENWGRHTAHILLPDKYYRLVVETQSSRRRVGNNDWDTQTFTEYMFFKTGEPPGTNTLTTQPSNEEAKSKYPYGGILEDLHPYIDTVIPQSRPPNEPQILHYRSYDIGVLFNDSYIEQMYHAAGYSLGIKLLDNNQQVVLNVDGEDLFANTWGSTTSLVLTREENLYQTLWDKENCLGVNSVSPQSNQELIARSAQLDLLPQTQYKAQIWAARAHQIYEFNFKTSRYANFLHHLHDYQDVAWDHMSLLADPLFELDNTVLESILDNPEDHSTQVQFEQLMQLFDLNPRPLPQQLEILCLNDRVRAYGILLETPEPLAHDRVNDISLLMAKQSLEYSVFTGSIKIINAQTRRVNIQGAVTGSPAASTETIEMLEKIEILLLKRCDLSGYRIEFGDPLIETESFNTVYEFVHNSEYPAGTKIIIHTASESDLEDEYTHINVVPINQWYAANPTVRLRDSSNKLIHQRSFVPADKFEKVDTYMIHNFDGTRLFIFIKDRQQTYLPMNNHSYQIKMTYQRDLGNDDKPVLKRFGFSQSETVKIDYSLPALLSNGSV